MKTRTLKILLIEDNKAEVYQVLDAIMTHNEDGMDVISSLEEKRLNNRNNYPDLIILDLNLPQHSGRQLISDIKKHEELKTNPIIVLTSSDMEDDIKTSYKKNISSYIVKPPENEEFQRAIFSALDFYSITQMPTNNYTR